MLKKKNNNFSIFFLKIYYLLIVIIWHDLDEKCYIFLILFGKKFFLLKGVILENTIKLFMNVLPIYLNVLNTFILEYTKVLFLENFDPLLI